MFAILVFERNPLEWSGLSAAMQSWVQDTGGLAFFALLFCGLVRLMQGGSRSSVEKPALARLMVGLTVVSGLMYICFLVTLAVQWVVPDEVVVSLQKISTWRFTDWESRFLTLGGGFALLAAAMPPLLALRRMSGRRIWAIARLSIKESIRQRVLWVFTLLILVVLFASWFIDSDKPEFQLRNYVWVVDGSSTLLLLLAASLLAAFSIPGDVRTQTIHTVVTKPVERFEIVMGRFVGYTLLMTAVLAVVTGLSMLYLFRNINEEAKKEDYKARVPVYGEIDFSGDLENPGKEFTHRKYISGGSRREAPIPNYAIWSFSSFPARLAEREGGVPCEFSFDVYRTHKGELGKGIFCRFLFVARSCPVTLKSNAHYEPVNRQDIAVRQAQLEAARHRLPGHAVFTKSDNEAIANQLAEEMGFYDVPSQEVENDHTQRIIVPPGLFKNALKPPAEGIARRKIEDSEALLAIYVNVSEKSRGQLVGVATHDLYLLDNERSFEENFLKGAVGLWFRLCLLIGIAVGCSTYLSGIISWICTMFIFGLGVFKDEIRQVTLTVGGGGGPMESMLKLASARPIAGQLDKTSGTQVAYAIDEAHRWIMNYLLKLIPDVNRFDLSQYVANGFDISWSGVLLLDNLIPLVGYLAPWAILSYYMIKSREIANPT